MVAGTVLGYVTSLEWQYAVSLMMILPESQTGNLRHRERRARDAWREAPDPRAVGTPLFTTHFAPARLDRLVASAALIKVRRSWFLQCLALCKNVLPSPPPAQFLHQGVTRPSERGLSHGEHPPQNYVLIPRLTHSCVWLWFATCVCCVPSETLYEACELARCLPFLALY